jgi:hypothetical protein
MLNNIYGYHNTDNKFEKKPNRQENFNFFDYMTEPLEILGH